MKQQAWRRHLASYPAQGTLQPRHADVDRWQHLNNTALITMHGEACQRWLRDTFGAGVWRKAAPSIALQDSVTDFLAEAQYPESLTTGVRLLGVDGAGFRLGSALFQDGQCVGLHQATMAVWADGLPVPLPEPATEVLHRAAARQPALDAGPAGAGADAPLQHPLVSQPGPAFDAWPWRTRLATRFADSDAHGQTSDTSLARYAEQMRVDFLTQVFGARSPGMRTGFVVGRVALRWLHRGRPPAEWRAAAGVTRLGERSMAVRGALFDDDTCRALCDSVLVAIDAQTRRSTTMPAASRAVLAPFRLHGTPDDAPLAAMIGQPR